MSAISSSSATAEQSPISYEEEIHSDTNSQQVAVAPVNQSIGFGMKLLMHEDASHRARIQNKSANNEYLYEKFQKHFCFGSPKADLVIQAMKENVKASVASFNSTMDSNQLYYTIAQMRYLLNAQLESNSPDAFDTAATLRQLTLRAAIGDLKEMFGGSNPLQLMKELIEIELSYSSLSSYLDQDLKTFIKLAENYRKEDPSEGKLIDELLLSLVKYLPQEKQGLLLPMIQDPTYHLEGLIVVFETNAYYMGPEEREKPFEELLKRANINHPRIALKLFKCLKEMISPPQEAENFLIKAKELARALHGYEREDAFKMIIECEMKYQLPTALETYNELKSFSK